MSEIEIKQSAYKHGCTYDDIINCYRFPILTEVLVEDESKYLYIGLDMNGRPIELLVNHNAVSVIFHAMKLRKVFEKLIGGGQ
jgi:hypothetical protein